MHKQLSYADSVKHIRSIPDLHNEVLISYLDEDNLAAAQRFYVSEEYQALRSLLKLDEGPKSILDLGCGNGITSYAFAKDGNSVTAVDPDLSDDVGLEATRRILGAVPNDHVNIVAGAAEAIPFPDNYFDIVYTRQALHHFNDPIKGLQECSRVLKPLGLLCLTREHVISDTQQKEEFLKNHTLHHLHGGENAYQLETYLNFFMQANLRCSKILRTFDTIINHYPISNQEVNSWYRKWLVKHLGLWLGNKLSDISLLETFYRRRLSNQCVYPGRMYSFCCVKQG